MTSAERFLKRLRSLDATAKAALRASAPSPHIPDVAAHDAFTAAFWPIRNSQLPRDPCRVVAALYFWHPELGKGENLAASLRVAVSCRRLDEKKTGRLVKELLAASFVGLPGLLLTAVRRLAATRVAINWPKLIQDLSRWDRLASKESVQESWANSWLQIGGEDVD